MRASSLSENLHSPSRCERCGKKANFVPPMVAVMSGRIGMGSRPRYSVAKLEVLTDYEVGQLSARGDAARIALKDKLLPLLRQQSDDLDAVLRDLDLRVLPPDKSACP
ncbi:MAG TPA: hypothetical protein VGY54_01395 [Polyangiaceae bacterium]|nr:hypothetical protein [Polyangiaceae bacterium]